MEHSQGCDRAAVLTGADGFEIIRYRTLWLCEKWSEEAVTFARGRLSLPPSASVGSAALRELGIKPELIEERIGNILLNNGIAALLDLLCGVGGITAFNNANARIGVGDSTTAEAASQTDLQAAVNKTYKAMNATYPSRAAQTTTWQSDFLTGDANYAWQEWSVDNGAAAGVHLNRKVQSFGTKVTGTWTLTGQITIS